MRHLWRLGFAGPPSSGGNAAEAPTRRDSSASVVRRDASSTSQPSPGASVGIGKPARGNSGPFSLAAADGVVQSDESEMEQFLAMGRDANRLQSRLLQRALAQRMVVLNDSADVAESHELAICSLEEVEQRLKQAGSPTPITSAGCLSEEQVVWSPSLSASKDEVGVLAPASASARSLDASSGEASGGGASSKAGCLEEYGLWLTRRREQWLQEDHILRSELDELRKAQTRAATELLEVLATPALSRPGDLVAGREPGSAAAAAAGVLATLVQSCADSLVEGLPATAANESWANDEAGFLENVAPLLAGALPCAYGEEPGGGGDPACVAVAEETTADEAALAKLNEQLEARARRLDEIAAFCGIGMDASTGSSAGLAGTVLPSSHSMASPQSTARTTASAVQASTSRSVSSATGAAQRGPAMASPRFRSPDSAGAVPGGIEDQDDLRDSQWLLSSRSLAQEDAPYSLSADDRSASASSVAPAVAELEVLAKQLQEENEAMRRKLQVQVASGLLSKAPKTPTRKPSDQEAVQHREGVEEAAWLEKAWVEELQEELADVYTLLAERALRREEAAHLKGPPP